MQLFQRGLLDQSKVVIRVRFPVGASFLGLSELELGLGRPLWRNWIAHPPSKREVVGSSPTRGKCRLSFSGRATAL
jgi:hypothetical protein